MAFPDDRDRELKKKSYETLGLADELFNWVGKHNQERIEQDLGAIRPNDEFRLLTLRRKAASLYRSSQVPVAAAVYGASQVGKSLFVGRVMLPQDAQFSPLGRDEKVGPPAYEPRLSFDHDLNPRCGSQEATAIVTRFTTKDRFDPDALQQYPVLVRSLSRSEWLRVLARGFRSECELPTKQKWEDADLEGLFEDVSSNHMGQKIDRQWRMDLLDVYSYLKRLDPLRYYSDESMFNGLLSRYALDDTGYTEIAARLCWGGWPEITDLFSRICNFLEMLESTKKPGMLAHWAAVRFLLDSQRTPEHVNSESKVFRRVGWNDLVDRIEDGWYVLDYQPGQGPPKEKLSTIQSSMLEMVIPVIPDRLTAEWRHVLEQIDFLDIPGMRAERGGVEGKMTRLDKDPERRLDQEMTVVKRGKVFYLFDRYIEELQAQTLVMLIRGGSLDVRGLLKEYVDKWGLSRYGKELWPREGPKKVRDDPPALFLGMTGIDDEFKNEDAKKALYDARLKQIVNDTFMEIMTDFGGPGRPFRNVYPIRYPGTWDYDSARRKRENLEHKWELAGKEFLASDMVKTYVERAEEKWKAAMRDGDGGASLIAAAIRDTTSAVRKQDELNKSINQTHEELLQLARNWLVDPNTNLNRERRLKLAQDVLTWFEDDNQMIFHRVQALEQSLCFQPGDVFQLADVAEIHAASQNPLEDLEERFSQDLLSFLKDWGTDWAPSRWQEYVGWYGDGQGWLDPEAFGNLSKYLADYLCSPEVFEDLKNRLLKVVSLKVRDEGARRQARRKFVRLVLNDYVMNPGGDKIPLEKDVDLSNLPDFGLMTKFVHRWMTRLPEVLAVGGGENVGIPQGNDELFQILEPYV